VKHQNIDLKSEAIQAVLIADQALRTQIAPDLGNYIDLLYEAWSESVTAAAKASGVSHYLLDVILYLQAVDDYFTGKAVIDVDFLEEESRLLHSLLRISDAAA
jgi:hypothetical protein